MALNPDPKPGRWILPLVVLGMVAFTYFFVRELPADNVDQAATSTPTSTPDQTGTSEVESSSPTTSTPNTVSSDPATQAYLDGVNQILATATDLQTEMTAINDGFDAEPRTVEYGDAVDRLEALGATAEEQVTAIDALTPPDNLTDVHNQIRTAIVTISGASDDALAGLQSTDDGSQRRNALTAFDQGVADLQTAIDTAASVAGATGGAGSPDTTESPDTTDGG